VNIVFDEEKALEVFQILNEEWKAKRGVFENIILPEDRMKLPQNKRQKVNFLFYSALFMRGGVISEDPFRWLFELYKERPGYFDPKFIVKHNLTQDDLKNAFLAVTPKVLSLNGSVRGRKENGSGTPFAYKIDQHTQAWIANSHFFVNEWDGDILNVFRDVKDFEEAFARISLKDRKKNGGDGIIGMRRKIFSLFTIWLQKEHLVPHFPTPIPVDFHALRVLWGTRIFHLPDVSPFEINDRHPKSYEGKRAVQTRDKLIDSVTKWSQVFLFENKISHMVINPALWVLSRDLCANHFQNSTAAKGTILREPEQIRLRKISWPKGYANPCSICPIEKYCLDVAPAAPYYIWGILMKMERIPYPFAQVQIQTQTVLPGTGTKEVHPVLARIRRRTKK
jgi:hypothetical protein